ncbi:MAG: hypothetical protein ACFCU3_00265 [Verrucomicrobiales bacterium]
MLISAEALALMNEEAISDVLQWAEGLANVVRVVALARNPQQVYSSLVQEHLKHYRTLNESIEVVSKFTYFKRRLRIWNKLADRIEVYDYDQIACQAGGLLTGFCNILAVRQDAILKGQPATRRNAALSMLAAKILDWINGSQNWKEADDRTRIAYAELIESFISMPGERFRLEKHFVESRNAAFEEDAAWLEEHFGISYKIRPETEHNQNNCPLSDEQASFLGENLWSFHQLKVKIREQRAAAVSIKEEIAQLKAQNAELAEKRWFSRLMKQGLGSVQKRLKWFRAS